MTEMLYIRTYLLRFCASTLILLHLLVGCNTAPPESPETDREALITLYNSANGEEWDNLWQIDAPMNEWHGVTVDSRGRVVELDLEDNNLNGYLPTELGNLSHLKLLNLSDNRLKEEIPAELGNLARLEVLNLNDNILSGEIPAEFL